MVKAHLVLCLKQSYYSVPRYASHLMHTCSMHVHTQHFVSLVKTLSPSLKIPWMFFA